MPVEYNKNRNKEGSLTMKQPNMNAYTGSVVRMLKALLVSYVVTGLLLLLIAGLLYRFQLDEGKVQIGIILTYILSCFAGGFLIGKKKKVKKYLWGLCVGAFYFVVLLLGNLAVNRGLDGQLVHMLTTAVLCILSGMAGGMLS